MREEALRIAGRLQDGSLESLEGDLAGKLGVTQENLGEAIKGLFPSVSVGHEAVTLGHATARGQAGMRRFARPYR